MPIVELELVIDDDSEELGPEQVQRLADQMGSFFGSEAAGTWVKVRYLDRGSYAENGLSVEAESPKPTFVSVMKYQLPGENQLVDQAQQLAGITAGCINRPVENTHIIFEPTGRGRVAFGGVLAT